MITSCILHILTSLKVRLSLLLSFINALSIILIFNESRVQKLSISGDHYLSHKYDFERDPHFASQTVPPSILKNTNERHCHKLCPFRDSWEVKNDPHFLAKKSKTKKIITCSEGKEATIISMSHVFGMEEKSKSKCRLFRRKARSVGYICI